MRLERVRKIAMILVPVLALSLTACDVGINIVEDSGEGGNEMFGMQMQSPTCGGTTNNTDYDAPKEIKSNKLISFETSFFHYGEYGSEFDGYFYFHIKPDETGKLILSEDWKGKESCEVDESVLDGIQEIIKKYDLVKSNGINRKTYGLPGEFETCTFVANYDSGEKIEFSDNSDPRAKWSAEVRDYLAEVFGEHGIETYLPPKETQKMTRFSLEFTDGDIRYAYGEIMCPKEDVNYSFEEMVNGDTEEDDFVKKFYCEPWVRSDKDTICERQFAKFDPEMYVELQKIVEETSLKDFENGNLFPAGFDYAGTPDYYEFYIEYEYGNRIMGFSDSSEDFEKFRPAVEKIKEYLDNYIEANKD